METSGNSVTPDPLNKDFRLVALVGNSRAYTLMVALVGQILLSSLSTDESFLIDVYQAFVILAVILVAADNRRHLMVGLALGIPSLVLTITDLTISDKVSGWITYIFVVALYLFVIRMMLIKIFKTKKVTFETIGFAICTYLLLGSVFTILYAGVVILNPDAFSQSITQAGSSPGSILTYFSFVTLTTLGYGDISPVSPIARSLAILEALTGTLFLAVLISRLVGAAAREK
ncbi:MAG: hypothetical protein ACI9UK_002123 [Candidatus Krumholzibacteriia bacterium]|jgi:hypothetical protein